MTQRELARHLGLSESAVSRLAKQGMPTHSVDAAKAWRRAKVSPYIKSQPSTPAPPLAPRAPLTASAEPSGPRLETAADLRAFAAATPDPIEFIEALAHNTAILAADDLLAVLHALAHAVGAALRTGGELERYEAPLRALMRHVPNRLRERVQFDLPVWRHLLSDYLQSHEPDPAGAGAGTPAETLDAGLHLYGLACGEWVPR